MEILYQREVFCITLTEFLLLVLVEIITFSGEYGDMVTVISTKNEWNALHFAYNFSAYFAVYILIYNENMTPVTNNAPIDVT